MESTGKSKASTTVEEKEPHTLLKTIMKTKFDYPPTSSAREVALSNSDQESQEDEENQEKEKGFDGTNSGIPSKYSLYQQSVQVSGDPFCYLQKGHKLSSEVLSDVRWWEGTSPSPGRLLRHCSFENRADVSSRISLFHGNVLQPLESKLVNGNPLEIMQNMTLEDNEGDSMAGTTNSELQGSPKAVHDTKSLKDVQLPARDIVCAFNYSCCCLHNRKDLILYFKHALNALSRKGGIFVMDFIWRHIFRGCSKAAEENPTCQPLRTFPLVEKPHGRCEFEKVRKVLIRQKYVTAVFRTWSLPEVKDCLEEAGFRSVHFWIRNMPDSEQIRRTDGFSADET
ncbi:hypothetical protein DH2020_046346 [Rehmannia glutinosa]|uniref:Uncharacterized protein n=1 Tax=Rehmannia glutinosa TaxID=99300 RepID=A0ABR0UBL3_REHGL